MDLGKKIIVLCIMIALFSFAASAASPVVSSANITSTDNLNRTNGTLRVVYTVTDGDGDDTKNITSWRVNGTNLFHVLMPFEKNATGTNTKDYSGFGNDGVEKNGITWNATGGYDGKGAYELDGVNDYIELKDFGDGITEYAIRLKVKQGTNPPGANYYFSGGSTIAISVDRIAIYNGSGSSTSTNYTVTSGIWYDFVVNVNDTHTSFYSNGEYVDAKPGGIHFGAYAPLAIGRWGASYEINATVDDFMFFNRSLTSDQIKTLYRNMTDSINSSEIGYGDNWSACITANDGTNDSAEVCSNNLTVESTAPVVSNVVVSSDDDLNRTNGTLTVTYSTSDAEGDSLKNITNWRLNGSSIFNLIMPFERVGGNNVKDYSGNGYDGLIYGGVVWNATGGYDGFGAYEFDGVDDHIRPNGIGSTKITEYAVHMKIKSAANVGAGVKYFFIGGCGVGVNNNRIWFYNGSLLVNTNHTISSNTWYDLTFNINETHTSVWIDGNYIDATPGGLYLGRYTVDIGWWGSATFAFNGTIDDVLIFNRSLTSDQIGTLANSITDSINSSETSYEDVWSACVTPNDGTSDGTEVCSSDFTIGSTAPTITAPVFNPTNPDDKETVTATSTYSDVDKTPGTVYFLWYVNGVNVHNETNSSIASGSTASTTLHFNNFSAGDNLSLSVYANDGVYNSTTESTEVTIRQSPVCNYDLWVNLSSGSEVFTIDCNGNVISDAKITAKDFTLTSASGDTAITTVLGIPYVRSLTAGGGSTFGIFAYDGDATDDVFLSIFGYGTPDQLANTERLDFGWSESDKAYFINSRNDGATSTQNISIHTGSRYGQLLIQNDGNISINDSLWVNKTVNAESVVATGESEFYYIHVTNEADFSGPVTFSGGLELNDNLNVINADSNLGGDVNISGDLNNTGNVYVGGSVNASSISTNSLLMTGNIDMDDNNITNVDSIVVADAITDVRFSNYLGIPYLRILTSGAAFQFALFTQDGDGTDDSATAYFGQGTPDQLSNTHSLITGWDSSEDLYTINSRSTGSGVLKNLSINTANNFRQLFIRDDGDVDILNNLDVGANFTGNQWYGEMWNYSANATAWTFSIGASSIYYNLTGLIEGSVNGFTYTSNATGTGGSYLTTEVAGLYKVDFSMSFQGSVAGGVYGIGVVEDFDVDNNRNCYARRIATGNVGNVGVTCFMGLNVGDTVNVQIEDESAPAKDIMIHTVNLNLMRIGD